MFQLAIFLISAIASNAAPPMPGHVFPGAMHHFPAMGGHAPPFGMGMASHVPHFGGGGGGGVGSYHVPFEHHRPRSGDYFGLPRYPGPVHHGEHGLSMPSHPVPVYGEPGVRVSGLGMDQYYGGYTGNVIYGGNGGYHSESNSMPTYHSPTHAAPPTYHSASRVAPPTYHPVPSVRWHGAGPGHAGIPVVDHGTARAIHEIMKGHDRSSVGGGGGHSPRESGSNNVLLGIPIIKGQKLTLPGFLIHSGGGAGHSDVSDLMGAHSTLNPKVVFGGVKPIVIDHAGSYSNKYPITADLVKELGKGHFKNLKGQKLWG